MLSCEPCTVCGTYILNDYFMDQSPVLPFHKVLTQQ